MKEHIPMGETDAVNPDYAEMIADRKRRIEELNESVQQGGRLAEAEEQVAHLEAEVYQFERAERIVAAKERIQAHKERIAEINTAVSRHELSLDQAEPEVLAREREIYILEGDSRLLDVVDAVDGGSAENSVPENLPIAEVDDESRSEVVPHEEETPENVDEAGDAAPAEEPVEPVPEEAATTAEQAERAAERAEYIERKRAFKESQRAYIAALETDYADRNLLKKLAGLGRKDLSPEVQAAYDSFMAANQAFYDFANSSDHYQRVAARLNRERTSGDEVPLNTLVADRHILRPARERLELQQMHLPEGVSRLTQTIRERIRQHPRVAIGVGSLALVLNPAAVIAGLGVKYVGNRFYVRGKERTEEQVTNEAIAAVDSTADLRALAENQFEASRQAHDARVRTNVAAVGAAVAAGSAYGSYGEETVLTGDALTEIPAEDRAALFGVSEEELPGMGEMDAGPTQAVQESLPTDVEAEYVDLPRAVSESEGWDAPSNTTQIAEETLPTDVEAELVTLPEALSEDEVVGSAFESSYTVEKGDTLSRILLDSVRARVEAGELTLPPGVDADRLAHYLYQSFPEFTNAADINPRLSPLEWQELGVSSGDPHLIRPGETIDVQSLIDKIWGTATETTATPDIPTPTPEATVTGAETAPAPESIILDKAAITAKGDLVFLTPEGVSLGEATEVVSPFSNESAYVKMPGEELIDVMMQRIEADVRSGAITLDAGQDLNAVREQILDRYPELQAPDELMWFQRTATPGLSPEVWREIGVVGADPLEIPNGTTVDMARLLNEVFGFRPEGEPFLKPAIPPAAEVGVAAETISPPEATPAAAATEATPPGSYDPVELRRMVGDIQDPQLIDAAINELTNGYEPMITERLATLATPWQPGQTLHEHLYQTILTEYRAGTLNLPFETMKRVAADETALYGFIERHLPDVSENTLSKLFRGINTEALSPEQWRTFGIDSGNPRMIEAGESVRTGEIIKVILERAASATNKT